MLADAAAGCCLHLVTEALLDCCLVVSNPRHLIPSDVFQYLQAVREAVGIPVLANGNILSRADADACMAYTGTQGVLSAGLFLNQTAYS